MSLKIANKTNLQGCKLRNDFINLVPHLVEDFCRLRRTATVSVTEGDRNCKIVNNVKKKSSFQNDELKVQQMEIEIYDDPKPTPKEKIAFPRAKNLMDLKTHPVYSEFSQERKRAINKLIKKTKESEIKQISLIKDLQNIENGKNIQQTKHNKNWLQSIKNNSLYGQNLKESEGRTAIIWKAKNWKELPSSEITSSENFINKNQSQINKWKQQQSKIKTSYLNFAKQREVSQRAIFKRLSKPKQTYDCPSKKPWILTEALRSFLPSQRLLEISKPKRFLNPKPQKCIPIVKKSALQYNASQRISELAMPSSVPTPKHDDPYMVSRGALSASPSQRISELATPKRRVDSAHRKNPFQISHKALSARTSRHVRELAQPKREPSPFVV